MCARFVSYALTSKQWKDRVTSGCYFLQMYEHDPEFLNKIITGDESWCFAYNLESKHQSATWVGPRSPKAKKLCFEKSSIKTMLVAFFDSRGLIHKDLSQLCKQLMLNFIKMFWIFSLKELIVFVLILRTSGEWFLQHDNALAHNAASVRQFLAKKIVTVLHHPPYSLQKAQADYFLFPKLKLQLKRSRFEDVTIKKNVTDILKGILEMDYKHALDVLAERSQKCIDLNSVYRIITIKYFFLPSFIFFFSKISPETL